MVQSSHSPCSPHIQKMSSFTGFHNHARPGDPPQVPDKGVGDLLQMARDARSGGPVSTSFEAIAKRAESSGYRKALNSSSSALPAVVPATMLSSSTAGSLFPPPSRVSAKKGNGSGYQSLFDNTKRR